MDDPPVGVRRRSGRLSSSARATPSNTSQPHLADDPSTRSDDVAESSASESKPEPTQAPSRDIYDSDEDGNSKEQYFILHPDKTSWDPLVVRKCVRPEFVHPGSTWDAPDFHALPPAKAAESRLAGTTVQVCFSFVFFPRLVREKILRRRLQPQRISNYLAAEITAQMTTGTTFDKFWDASHDLEEYIRQAIWPQVMQIDAVRLRKGLGSDVVALAKAISPPRAAGFNNDRFWGYSVYMALRFPPGSHPFTTPVVRSTLAQLRRCIVDGHDPWGSDYTNLDTQMALAASWAGYSIAHHLIDRNVYNPEPSELQLQRQQLDTLVWLASEAHVLVKDLFEEILLEKENIDTAATTNHLQKEMHRVQWDRIVGACHRVAYNWDKSLPLPLCKPSRILGEMQRAHSGDIEDWDDSTPFSTEFDVPLDPSVYKMKDSGLVLSENVSRKVNRVNEWLLAFLREEPRLDKVTADEFSYMPEELSLDEDDHYEPRGISEEVDDAPEEVGEPSSEPPSAPSLTTLQQELSEMKKSIACIENVIKDSKEAIDDIRCHLAERDMHLARLLAPPLLEQLEPALAKTIETRMQQAEATVSSLTDNMRTDIGEFMNFHLSESGECVGNLFRPLSDRLDNLEAAVAKNHSFGRSDARFVPVNTSAGPTPAAEARSRGSFSRSTAQRGEDDAPLANIDVNRNRQLSIGSFGDLEAGPSRELVSEVPQPRKRTSEELPSQQSEKKAKGLRFGVSGELSSRQERVKARGSRFGAGGS